MLSKNWGGDNLAPLVSPVMRKGGTDNESIIHGHAQRFALPLGEVELLPKTDILVDVLSGDTLSQSFVIETDATSINGSFTFFMNDSANHHIVPFNVQQLRFAMQSQPVCMLAAITLHAILAMQMLKMKLVSSLRLPNNTV